VFASAYARQPNRSRERQKPVREISKCVRELRTRVLADQTQEEFGKIFGVTANRVSPWESGKDVPPCHALITMGNLAAKNSAYELALVFWKKAGVDFVHGMAPVTTATIREELAEPQGNLVIAIPPLEGSGPHWYVDSRIVPPNGKVGYLDTETAQLRGTRRGAIVIDTAPQFNKCWGKLVLIHSLGRTPHNLGLPRHGYHLGYFDTEFDSASGKFVLEFAEHLLPMRRYRTEGGLLQRGSATTPELYRLGLYDPQLTPGQKSRLSGGLADSKLEQEVLLRAEREYPLPKDIRVIGRVLLIMQTPDEEQG
jgi:DNA-binding transcriptional regulator YiaG